MYRVRRHLTTTTATPAIIAANIHTSSTGGHVGVNQNASKYPVQVEKFSIQTHANVSVEAAT